MVMKTELVNQLKSEINAMFEDVDEFSGASNIEIMDGDRLCYYFEFVISESMDVKTLKLSKYYKNDTWVKVPFLDNYLKRFLINKFYLLLNDRYSYLEEISKEGTDKKFMTLDEVANENGFSSFKESYEQ